MNTSSVEAGRERLVTEVAMIVNGERTPSQNGTVFERRSPRNGMVVSRAPAASRDDARATVQAADRAFATWSETGPGVRRALLLKAAAQFEANIASFVDAVTRETGATAAWAKSNVLLSAGKLREAAALTTQMAGEVIPSDVAGCLSLAIRQPAGVVLGMAPWNAPVILAVRALAVPLACGNTVILKGSESCPSTHQLVVEAFVEAGFPAGVVNFISHAPEDAADVVDEMISHPAVRRVNFTGSTRVGRLIAQTCAKYLKPVLLELGGKAPLVVLDDADLDAAVNAAVFGAFANSGQICMSTERVIVDDTVADAFARKFAEKAASLPVDDGTTQHPGALGSVIGAAAVAHCNDLLEDALAKGAELICGGRGDSTLMAATVLDKVTPQMRIYREESFGPIKPIIRVDGVEDAIRCANDTEYGLAAAIFGRDVARAYNVARRIDSGICHINSATVNGESHMPFGGLKASGMGRFGGRSEIEEFTELRWITIQTTQRSYPF